ncbi:MAG: 4Fe-4S dicluster domain-containing protein [Sumerlaeia bacterium]
MTTRIKEFFIDFQRCIGCQACAAGCSECSTHRGTPMIHVDQVEPTVSPQTAPMVCMHCKVPTCAMACPADAIKMDENGIVHSSLKPRCIACSNCELSCPFGVPIIKTQIQQMQKCDMCFDRTSAGKKPMCATVCPTGALYYGTMEDMKRLRPHSKPINRWRFGNQVVETRVWVMVPHDVEEMVVDWPELLQGAEGPVDLAMKLKERFQLDSDFVDPTTEPLPLHLAAISATHDDDEEAEFL